MASDAIRKEAEARHRLHAAHQSHRPLSSGYELVGLRGEEALARYFGLSVDMTRRPNGDGGVDNTLRLDVGSEIRSFVTDVKTARRPYNLIIEKGKIVKTTIYILAAYYDHNDSAELLKWEWGFTMMQAPTKDFGHGVVNHYVPQHRLRDLAELRKRHRPEIEW